MKPDGTSHGVLQTLQLVSMSCPCLLWRLPLCHELCKASMRTRQAEERGERERGENIHQATTEASSVRNSPLHCQAHPLPHAQVIATCPRAHPIVGWSWHTRRNIKHHAHTTHQRLCETRERALAPAACLTAKAHGQSGVVTTDDGANAALPHWLLRG